MAVSEHSIVVDEQDKVVGYKQRDQLDPSDIYRTVIVWVEDGKGNALIHKRAAAKKYPGIWENGAGGGVEAGESYKQAAQKELLEEIGISEVELLPVAKTLIKTESGRRWCQWFKAIIPIPIDEFKPSPREVAELKWVNKSQLFADRDAHPERYMPSSAHWRDLFDGSK